MYPGLLQPSEACHTEPPPTHLSPDRHSDLMYEACQPNLMVFSPPLLFMRMTKASGAVQGGVGPLVRAIKAAHYTLVQPKSIVSSECVVVVFMVGGGGFMVITVPLHPSMLLLSCIGTPPGGWQTHRLVNDVNLFIWRECVLFRFFI